MPKNATKKTRVTEKEDSVEKNENMMLIRDDVSLSLMIVNAKALSMDRSSKLKVGMTIIWQDDGREQRQGQILAIG